MKNTAHRKALEKATRQELKKLPPKSSTQTEQGAILWMEQFSEALCKAKVTATAHVSPKQQRADNRRFKWPTHWDAKTKECARKKERQKEKARRIKARSTLDPKMKTDILHEIKSRIKQLKKELRRNARRCKAKQTKENDNLVAQGGQQGQDLLKKLLNVNDNSNANDLQHLENNGTKCCSDTERAEIMAHRYNSVSMTKDSNSQLASEQEKTLLPKTKEFMLNLDEFRRIQKMRTQQLRQDDPIGSRTAMETKMNCETNAKLLNKEPSMTETILAIKDLNLNASPGHMKLRADEIKAMLEITLQHHNLLH